MIDSIAKTPTFLTADKPNRIPCLTFVSESILKLFCKSSEDKLCKASNVKPIPDLFISGGKTTIPNFLHSEIAAAILSILPDSEVITAAINSTGKLAFI